MCVRLNFGSSGPRAVYVTTGNWHHPQPIIVRCCVSVPVAANGGELSVWRRGCGVGGVESGETAILQSTTTLCVTFPPVLLSPF